MLKTNGILEAVIYVRDLKATQNFYGRILGLAVLSSSPRLVAFDAGRSSVLLAFKAGARREDMVDDDGFVPGHDGHGRLHFALSIAASDLDEWRNRLTAGGIAIASDYRRARGPVSLYFHDPDGHVVELATPGVWANGPAAPATRDVAG